MGCRLSSVTSGQWFSSSCEYKEVSIKTWKDRVRELLGWWLHGGGGGHLEKSWKPCFHSPVLALSFPLIWLFLSCIILWSTEGLVSNMFSLNSVSCFSKLVEPAGAGMVVNHWNLQSVADWSDVRVTTWAWNRHLKWWEGSIVGMSS